jgi:hypothetical protein
VKTPNNDGKNAVTSQQRRKKSQNPKINKSAIIALAFIGVFSRLCWCFHQQNAFYVNVLVRPTTVTTPKVVGENTQQRRQKCGHKSATAKKSQNPKINKSAIIFGSLSVNSNPYILDQSAG